MSKKINESRADQMNRIENQMEKLAIRLRKDGFVYQADQLMKMVDSMSDVQMTFVHDAKLDEEQ